ncbi:MAG: hypothetical protein V2A73_02350 [Pseudomonadota bacterium]
MARKKLGEILVQAGVLEEGNLRIALGEQRRFGGVLGNILVEMKFISEEVMVQALCHQLNFPAVNLDQRDIELEVIELVSVEMAEEHSVVPFDVQGRFLDIAMADPTNLSVIDELRIKTRLNVRPYLAGPKMIERALSRYYGYTGYGLRWKAGYGGIDANCVTDGIRMLESTTDHGFRTVPPGRQRPVAVGGHTGAQPVQGHPAAYSGSPPHGQAPASGIPAGPPPISSPTPIHGVPVPGMPAVSASTPLQGSAAVSVPQHRISRATPVHGVPLPASGTGATGSMPVVVPGVSSAPVPVQAQAMPMPGVGPGGGGSAAAAVGHGQAPASTNTPLQGIMSMPQPASAAGAGSLDSERREIATLHARIQQLEALVARDESVLRRLLSALIQRGIVSREDITDRGGGK